MVTIEQRGGIGGAHLGDVSISYHLLTVARGETLENRGRAPPILRRAATVAAAPLLRRRDEQPSVSARRNVPASSRCEISARLVRSPSTKKRSTRNARFTRAAMASASETVASRTWTVGMKRVRLYPGFSAQAGPDGLTGAFGGHRLFLGGLLRPVARADEQLRKGVQWPGRRGQMGRDVPRRLTRSPQEPDVASASQYLHVGAHDPPAPAVVVAGDERGWLRERLLDPLLERKRLLQRRSRPAVAAEEPNQDDYEPAAGQPEHDEAPIRRGHFLVPRSRGRRREPDPRERRRGREHEQYREAHDDGRQRCGGAAERGAEQVGASRGIGLEHAGGMVEGEKEAEQREAADDGHRRHHSAPKRGQHHEHQRVGHGPEVGPSQVDEEEEGGLEDGEDQRLLAEEPRLAGSDRRRQRKDDEARVGGGDRDAQAQPARAFEAQVQAAAERLADDQDEREDRRGEGEHPGIARRPGHEGAGRRVQGEGVEGHGPGGQNGKEAVAAARRLAHRGASNRSTRPSSASRSCSAERIAPGTPRERSSVAAAPAWAAAWSRGTARRSMGRNESLLTRTTTGRTPRDCSAPRASSRRNRSRNMVPDNSVAVEPAGRCRRWCSTRSSRGTRPSCCAWMSS